MPRRLVDGLDSKGFGTLKDAANIKAKLYLPLSSPLVLCRSVRVCACVCEESGLRGGSVFSWMVVLLFEGIMCVRCV